MTTYGPWADVRRQRHASLSLVALVGLVVTFVSALLVGGARSATEVSGVIAFVRGEGIYVMRADGSGVRPLWRGGMLSAFARDLAWSPDGQRLAFVADGRIWVMGADGSRPVRVTGRVPPKLGGPGSPSWSPDGRRIAYSYSAKPDVDRDVWVMNADGTNKRRLARTADCAEVDVDWSPRGGLLVRTCGHGWGTKELRLLSSDGSSRRSILTAKGVSAPDWSPDGRRIVFEKWGAFPGISVLSVGQHIAFNQFTLLPVTRRGVFYSDPVWSPDGRRIAFVHGSPQEDGIFVMNADGTGVTRLTRGYDRSPAWQPVSAP